MEKSNWRGVLNCFAKKPTEDMLKNVYHTRFHDPEVLNKRELQVAFLEGLREVRHAKSLREAGPKPVVVP